MGPNTWPGPRKSRKSHPKGASSLTSPALSVPRAQSAMIEKPERRSKSHYLTPQPFSSPVLAPWNSDIAAEPRADERDIYKKPDPKFLKRELRRQAKLRDELYGKRLQLKERRNELRYEKGLLIDIDNKFMKNVRQSREMSNRVLEADRAELDAQRDRIGSLQYEYDQIESEYDAAEYSLSEEEEKFGKLIGELFPQYDEVKEDDDLSIYSHSQAEPDDLPESIRQSNDGNEARIRVTEYQSRVGDARIVDERLQDLVYEHTRRLSFKKKRQALNIAENHSETDSEEHFEEDYAKFVDELTAINADIQRLADNMRNDGIEFSTLHVNGLVQARLSKHFSERSYQLQPPSEDLRPASDHAIPLLYKNFSVTRARISWWILNTIGNSPATRVKHKDLIQKLGHIPQDDESWARSVMKFWRQEEFEDNLSQISWEEILPQELTDDEFPKRSAKAGDLVLLASIPIMMNNVERYFPANHSTPYEAALDVDSLSHYESRSI